MSGGDLSVSRPSHIIAGLWRRLLVWRFRLLHARRYNRLALEEIAGKTLLVMPEVFNPRLLRSGEFLVRSLSSALIPPGSRVLDMGTGTGVGALFAAEWAERVIAVDINRSAVRCARINVLLHHLEDKVTVLEGDLFAPVEGQRFDVVLFNPPFFRGIPRDPLDLAWRSVDVVERFAEDLPNHLAAGGRALVVLSSDGETDSFLRKFEALDFSISVAARRNLINETLTMYRLERATGPLAR